jgi:hypothetical protein
MQRSARYTAINHSKTQHVVVTVCLQSKIIYNVAAKEVVLKYLIDHLHRYWYRSVKLLIIFVLL